MSFGVILLLIQVGYSSVEVDYSSDEVYYSFIEVDYFSDEVQQLYREVPLF
jgi:hypothetical protein